MPQAAQATRQSVKKQATIKEVHPTVLQVTIPEAGLLPERKCRPLSVFPGDDLSHIFPQEKKYDKLRGLIGKIKPGSGKIDHLIIIPGRKEMVLHVQLQEQQGSAGVRKRVESAVTEAGYPLAPAI